MHTSASHGKCAIDCLECGAWVVAAAAVNRLRLYTKKCNTKLSKSVRMERSSIHSTDCLCNAHCTRTKLVIAVNGMLAASIVLCRMRTKRTNRCEARTGRRQRCTENVDWFRFNGEFRSIQQLAVPNIGLHTMNMHTQTERHTSNWSSLIGQNNSKRKASQWRHRSAFGLDKGRHRQQNTHTHSLAWYNDMTSTFDAE